jgi:NADH dehydrogenase FAD-containing subunit
MKTHLVIAVGAGINFFGLDAIQQAGFEVKDIQKAVSTEIIFSRCLSKQSTRRMWRNAAPY